MGNFPGLVPSLQEESHRPALLDDPRGPARCWTGGRRGFRARCPPKVGSPQSGVTPIPVVNALGGKLRRHGGKQAQLLRFSLLLRAYYIPAANCGLLPGVRLARTSLAGRKTWAGKQIRRRKQHSFPTSRSSQASKFSAGISLLTFYGEKTRLSFGFAGTCPSVNPTCALIPTGARAPARRDALSTGLCRGKAQLEAPDGAC